ncbi:MAG: crossover junction endodeoxyribonuclease RuvC [Rikenellaceae bacterium]
MRCNDGYRVLGIDPGTNYMGYGVIEIRGSKPHSVVMGVVDLHRLNDPYQKLSEIFKRLGVVIDEYGIDEMALESPFFGENVQSMLKLGRAQGVAMSAALSRGIDVFEYAPTKVKQSVAGNGSVSKESLARIIATTLKINIGNERLDATDAMAVALCHFYTITNPLNGHFSGVKSKGLGGSRVELSRKGSSSWEQFAKSNPKRIK